MILDVIRLNEPCLIDLPVCASESHFRSSLRRINNVTVKGQVFGVASLTATLFKLQTFMIANTYSMPKPVAMTRHNNIMRSGSPSAQYHITPIMPDTKVERPDLGPVHARFRPGTENIFAGGILGLLFTGGGGALLIYAIRQIIFYGGKLPFQAKGQTDWMGVGLMAFFGVVAVLIGIGAFALVRSQLLSFSVTLCANGFYCSRQGQRTDFPWESISSVQETITHARMHMLRAAKYALPERISHSYTVRRNDGQTVEFYEDNIKQLPELMSLIRQELKRRQVPWNVTEEKA